MMYRLLALTFLLLLSACAGGGPGPQTDAPLDAEQFIDWDALDWKFPRYGWVNASLHNPINHCLSPEDYLEATRFKGPVGALDLEAFRSLSDDGRKARRAVAANHLQEAMVLQRILWRSWEIWAQSRRKVIASEAFTYGDGLLTHTLGHLETAAGLDPSNPFTWYHLAVLRGYAGDRERQREGIENALGLLDDPGTEDEALLRLRLLVDAAWLARDEGRFVQGLNAVTLALDRMQDDSLKTHDLAREALLLEALLLVDGGHIPEARKAARKLTDWEVPIQKGPAAASFAAPVLSKHNLEKISSDFAQNWVWALTYLKQDQEEPALNYQNKQMMSIEYPPHLGWRYWQDMGRLQEHFGHMNQADLCYSFALLHRPLLAFFPKQSANGLSSIFNQAGTGRRYFLAYGSHFLVGSYFSYAANRVVALEIAPTPLEKVRRAEVALTALDNCLAQGLRPASTLALRGRVHYRLGAREKAEADLARAHRLMRRSSAESADVVKLLAVLHFDRGDFDGALELLGRYNELQPRDGFGWRLGGVALAHQGELEASLSSLNVALDIDPQAGTGWYNRALVHLRLGNRERARQDLEYARRLMPGNDDIRRVAALVHDNPEANIKMTSDTVELRLSRTDSLMFANVDRTSDPDLVAALEEKELDRLMDSLKERYEQEPTASNRLALARTLVRSGKQGEAQALLAPHWPADLEIEEMKLLLRSDRALGRTRRAVTLAMTLRRDPDPVPDGDFWALVAVICLENGKAEAGQLALDAALEMDPNNVALLRMKFGSG